VDPTTVPAVKDTGPTEEETRIAEWRAKMPSVDSMLTLDDFEYWGEKVLSGQAWNYYRSAADLEISHDNNRAAFHRYYLRPRILRDVTNGSLESAILGFPVSMPVMISPAAMAKLGNPIGEVNLTRGAGQAGIIQGISINASCSIEEIMEARKAGQKVFFQVSFSRSNTVRL
jgi:L-lactate dehydrogenase (cytochrome)